MYTTDLKYEGKQITYSDKVRIPTFDKLGPPYFWKYEPSY